MFESVGSIKIKVVERTGSKVVDLLHKSNAWSDQNCNRDDCILCSSCSEEDKKGKCKTRNVTYEAYCETCEENLENERKLRALEVSRIGKDRNSNEKEESKRKKDSTEKKPHAKRDI